jgi:cytochrome c biogenesis protein CcdA
MKLTYGRVFALFLLLFGAVTAVWGADVGVDFFSDQPIPDAALVQLAPPKPAWMTVGGPIALMLFGLGLGTLVWLMIPFRQTVVDFDLRKLPVALQRGIGMTAIMFGISFLFGGFEVHYQLSLNGGAEQYFQNMGIGKLIAITHAHLFGFTTCFFLIGIPFSMHFNRLVYYQLVFPVGLVAALCDIVAWWGLKFISGNFEYVTWFCGSVFGICYAWMLIALIRVLFFPNIRWLPDYINDRRRNKMKVMRRRASDTTVRPEEPIK